eukprot:8948944-Prorocentrum_lima.AAC.1
MRAIDCHLLFGVQGCYPIGLGIHSLLHSPDGVERFQLALRMRSPCCTTSLFRPACTETLWSWLATLTNAKSLRLRGLAILSCSTSLSGWS